MDSRNHTTREQLMRYAYTTGLGPEHHPKVHRSGSMKCVGRCGATISANRKPPLCRACKLLFDAQVLVDQARAAAAKAIQDQDPPAEGAA